MSKLLLSSFLAVTILLSSCHSGEQELTILATTDVHGAFFSEDPVSGEQRRGSLAHFSAWLQAHPPAQHQLILDNGDLIQGDPAAYYFNFEKTDTSHLATAMLEYLGYEAVTVGNHDIEAGHPVYDRIRDELSLPLLAANCIDTETGEPWFEPYTIIRKGPLRIAVFGLITPAVPNWLPRVLWEGMEFEDMVETARKWIPRILEEENPDLLIGLFHSGMNYTYNQQDADTPKNENAVRLVAEQVAGLDIIFCGHDHQTWNEYILNPQGDSVLVLGSESRVREVGRADLRFKKIKGDWTITALSGSHVYPGDLLPDPGFTSHFAPAFEEIKTWVNEEVARLETPLDARESLLGPSAFMTLIHQVQLDLTGADISFAAPLSFNRVFDPGVIRVNDLFDLYRFENMLYTVSLTGQQIQDYLNYSYSLWMNGSDDDSPHLLSMQVQNGRGRTQHPYYHFDSALGLDYEVRTDQPADRMVTIRQLSDGRSFDPDQTYRVAINSYRGNGGGGHLVEGAGIHSDSLESIRLHATDKDLRYYMKSWLADRGTVRVETARNWQVLPAKTYQQKREADYSILFRN